MERTPEYYLTKGLDMVVNGVAAVIFLCCLAYAGYALWDNWSILDGSEDALKTMVEYKPDEAEGLSYNFSQLMAMNPDVCGWIVMDHTGIDYPIVQGEDNFEYLDKDALGNPEISGSIFLDWQNNRKFTDPYMVLMGHHMQAGKMFGDLDKYSDETFFRKNTTGKIVPIGIDSGDNYYCVNNETGKVYYWCASENTYFCISNSLSDFIALFD